MNGSLALNNIGLYSLQAAVLILAGLLSIRLLRIVRPLALLQGLLAVVLLLPVLQPWSRPVMKFSPAAPVRVVLPVNVLERVDVDAPINWPLLFLCFLGLGVLARTIWLLIGLARLRDLRQYSDRIVDGIAVSHEVTGPVTFGFLRPIILLPPAVLELPAPARNAILAHERAHIRRRDWLFALFEEVVLCVFWFHPAIWLLISRIRLVREQVVDLEASREAASVEVYVDALLAVSGARLQPYFAPAPPFLKRRQLSARVHCLVLENPMSSVRKLASYGVVLAGLFAAAIWVTASFPLRGAPQMTAQTPENISVQGAELVFSTRPVYPAAARAAKIEGSVALEVMIAANGEVADARVISGPGELRKAALAAVLNWQFRPGGGVARVDIDFRTSGPSMGPIVAKFFISESIPAAMAETLRARLKPFEGQPASADLSAVIAGVSPSLKVRMEQNLAGGVNEISVFIGPSLIDATVPGRIRVDGAVQAGNLTHRAEPAYPALARQARIQGTVRLNLTVGRDGAVSAIEVVSGHPLLIPAAVEAVRQYRYNPTLLNGQPVEVSTQADVNFML